MTDTNGNARVRRNLRYVRQEKDGKVSYIVKDPVTLKYFRFGSVEVWLMERMDGTRSSERLAEELREAMNINAAAASLDALARRLRELGLAERNPNERSLMLMESIRRDRRVRLTATHNTLLRMRFSFGDPDVLLGDMVKAMPFFWTPAFVIGSCVLFAAYVLVLGQHWTPFVHGLSTLYDPAGFSAGLLLTLYLTGTTIFLIHEMGHGLTCKRFGGEVHEMGAMLFYFSPAFFCNVNDAYTLEKRSQRLWVTFAGGWIQLCIAAVAAIVWVMTEPGTLVNRTAFIATLLGGGLSVLINYNPLIPLDGYYALVDWLDIANLRPRSFGYVGAALKRHVLRLHEPIPAVTPREHRIFLIYGSLSIAYTTFILSLAMLWIGRLLVHKMGGWGWFIFAMIALRVTKKLRVGFVRTARAFAIEKLPKDRARRFAFVTACALILCTAGAFVLPWTVRGPAVATVEPTMRSVLRAPERARLESVRPREGGIVAAGDTVAVLRAPDLEVAWSESRAAVVMRARELTAAESRGDATRSGLAVLRLAAERERFTALDRRRDALIVRAPFRAILATGRLDERIGEMIPAGASLLELWDAAALRARLQIEQRDAGLVVPGREVRMRFISFPGWTWRAHVAHIDPAATDDHVFALAAIGSGDNSPRLRPGMRGDASIVVLRTHVASAINRALHRTIRLDFLL